MRSIGTQISGKVNCSDPSFRKKEEHGIYGSVNAGTSQISLCANRLLKTNMEDEKLIELPGFKTMTSSNTYSPGNNLTQFLPKRIQPELRLVVDLKRINQSFNHDSNETNHPVIIIVGATQQLAGNLFCKLHCPEVFGGCRWLTNILLSPYLLYLFFNFCI